MIKRNLSFNANRYFNIECSDSNFYLAGNYHLRHCEEHSDAAVQPLKKRKSQKAYGLPRLFKARNDGSFCHYEEHSDAAVQPLKKRKSQKPYGLPRLFKARNDGSFCQCEKQSDAVVHHQHKVA